MKVPADDQYQQEIVTSGIDSGYIQRVLLKYLAHWKWFIISFIFFVAFGLGYIYLRPSLYMISASILIKDHNTTDGSSTLEELDLFYKAKVVENEIELLRSYTLMEEVVDNLNLQVRYAMKEGWKTKEVYGNLPVHIEIIASTTELFSRPFKLYFEDGYIFFDEKLYPYDALISESFGSLRITASINDSLPIMWNRENPIIVNFLQRASLIESLHNRLQVSLVKNTSVIKLTMLSPIPECGKDIINQLIITYNKAAIADKNNMAGITLNFIEERLELVKTDLQKAEQNVEQYKTKEGVTDISAESSLYLQHIQHNDAELSKVKTQFDLLRQIEQYVLSNSSMTVPATLGLSDPTLISLMTSLTETEAERIRTLSTTQPANFKVRALDDQITTLKGKLIDNINMLRRSLETSQRNLRSDIRRIETSINSLPKKERELVDITRQKEIINQIFIFLLSKREETAISYAATVGDSRIVDAARTSTNPVKPNKRLLLMVFGFIGFLFPAGILWLIDCFKTTFSSKDELENQLKAPIVGEISLVEQANKLVVFTKNKSRQAEQIRSLRTNIEFMRADGGIKIILITSGISNEGKSFLSANLGSALAIMGKKTVLLGFDLRKSGLDNIFGINNTEGLSNYLSGQISLDQIIHTTDLSENLFIITGGRIPPNPQELLLGETLSHLFDQLKEQFDCIIIDTSPVGLISDAMILDRFSDVTLYVIRQNFTPKDRIKHINELYKSKRLKNLGVVVNGIKDKHWNGYGYSYGYGLYKYYAKYYGSEEQETDD